jgi:hypothetical protein
MFSASSFFPRAIWKPLRTTWGQREPVVPLRSVEQCLALFLPQQLINQDETMYLSPQFLDQHVTAT